MTRQTLRQASYIFFTAFAAGLFVYISLPYITAIVFALVFSVLVQPIHRRSVAHFGASHLAATLTMFISMVVIILPLTLLLLVLADSTSDIYQQLQADNFAHFSQMSVAIAEFGERYGLEVEFSLRGLITDLLTWLSANVDRLFSTTVTILISVFIWFILSYFAIKDGCQLRSYVTEISPLGVPATRKIIDRLQLMINAVFRVSLLMGLFQGITAGIGFWWFGVPYAFALGALTTILALLPAIGVTLVMVLSALYLYYTGTLLSAIGLLIWGAVVVGLAEDIVRPYIVGRYNDVHTALILLSVLGGVAVFGIIGLILGPIILAFFLAMLEESRSELTTNAT